MEDGRYDVTTMNCSDTDQLPPLTVENYGQYLNESIEYYRSNPVWVNFSDVELAAEMCNTCQSKTEMLKFTGIQLFRVIITWTLFLVSAVGNIFVLCCVCGKAKTSHVHMIMMHFAIADLTFTFLVLPEDAMWNSTMEWLGGEFLCRMCQMGKQTGMYISSLMVVVTALDRCYGLLQAMSTPAEQRKRTKYFVGGAWILSVISAIPAPIIFAVGERAYCPQRPAFLQCIDNTWIDQGKLRPYYFYTMAMSFLLPMILCFVFYSLVVCEITNMMKRDRVITGRRDSSVSIMRARKKIVKLTALVTLSFVLLWGPYYGFGVYFWFHPKNRPSNWAATFLFVLMYVHPAIHPFIYGLLMKDVRDAFRNLAFQVQKIVTCNASERSVPHGSPSDARIDEVRRARDKNKSSTDNSTTATTYCRPATRLRWGDGGSSSDASPLCPELTHLRHNGDSVPVNFRDACMSSLERPRNLQVNGGTPTKTPVYPDEDKVPELSSVRQDSTTSGERNSERDGLIVQNGTARVSQVSFRLLPDEPDSNVSAVIGLNNNNEEGCNDSNGHIIIKSTDV